MNRRELTILFSSLSVVMLLILAIFAASGGWPFPCSPPSPEHAKAACRMYLEHATAAEIQIPHSTRVAYWWQSPNIPEHFDPFTNQWVSAESLVRIDSLNADGEIYDSDWVFLRWNGMAPYCVAVLYEKHKIPQKYR